MTDLLALLKEAREVLGNHWFSSEGEESYNNDDVIAMSERIDAALAEQAAAQKWHTIPIERGEARIQHGPNPGDFTIETWTHPESAPELPPLPEPDYVDTDGVASTQYWRVESFISYGRACQAPLLAEIEMERNNKNMHRERAEKAERERDALKLQAQCWAAEARTQTATVHESYQACTGATGEPADWNGAEPIRKLVAERDELRAQLEAARKDAARWRWLRKGPATYDGPVDDELEIEIDRKLSENP